MKKQPIMSKKTISDKRVYRGGFYRGSNLREFTPSHRRKRDPKAWYWTGRYFCFRIVRNKDTKR